MSYSRCEHCGQMIEQTATLGDKSSALLRALNLGPRTLGQLAVAVHGRDTATNRRKVSYLIKKCLRDVLDTDGRGTWRFAQAAEYAEAAE